MFDMPIILYLFLGGAGSGACLVLAVAGLFVPRERVVVVRSGRARRGVRTAFAAPSAYRNLFAPAYACSLVAMLLGMLCLAADLGRADRLLLLLVSPTFSHIAVGAYAFAACFVLALVLALAWAGVVHGVSQGFVRVVEILLIPIALIVMVYTGLLLQSLAAVPLWAVFWLPAVFVLSSLSCGIALVAGVAHLGSAGAAFAPLFRRVVFADAAVIVLEALSVAAFLVACAAAAAASASGTAQAAASSYTELVAGANAGLWWFGFAGMGLALPLVLEVVLLSDKAKPRGLALAASACVLFGGFVMRFCIVEAGMHPVIVFAAGG